MQCSNGVSKGIMRDAGIRRAAGMPDGKGRIVGPVLEGSFVAGTASTIAGWRYAHYDGIVAVAACAHFRRGRGVRSMIVALLVAGIGALLAGLLAIAFGIPVKEFSFGNTLILTGAIAACTGMIMLGLWVVVRELKDIARRLGPGISPPSRAIFQPAAASAPRHQAPEDGGFPFGGQPETDDADHAESSAPAIPPPWQDEAAARDRGRSDTPPAPEPAEAAPAVKPRRNLLFSSSSRKERERAQARVIDPSTVDLPPALAPAPPASESAEPPPATFDDAWPKPERSKAPDAPSRRDRAPTTFTAATAGASGADRYPPAARTEEPPPVTVLKSGVVDGMAYSLYSDGSIEAQMPEGMMRFASIDELRAHLDHRP
jgi:hypothetical protein